MLKAPPRRENFEQLVDEIEHRRLFNREPGRFRIEREILGRFTLNQTKSFFAGDTVYEIIEEGRLTSNETTDGAIGFRICHKDGQITKAQEILDPRNYSSGYWLPYGRRYI